ncbi:MAG: GAF domain-containing protein [Candidatus Promineofilum sp.]|nr:GAF domain-containing protein [Promineifilum sp.]
MVDDLDFSTPTHDQRLNSLAQSWRVATRDLAFIPLTQNEIRQRFLGLAADVLDAVQPTTAPEVVFSQGRAIGRALVELNLLKSDTLERTLTCLNEHLIDATAPQQLGRLLAGIAGGFAAATETALLSQQEAINRAATSALIQVQAQLSDQIAERTRAEVIQREYAERLERMRDIDLAILSAESPRDIVDICIDHLRQIVPAINIAVITVDRDHYRSVVLSSTHIAYPSGRDQEITLIHALNQLDAGETVYIKDLRELPPGSPDVSEIVELGGRSLLAVPLRSHDTLTGVLTITLGETRPFTATEVAVAQELAGSVAIAIQNHSLLAREKKARQQETTLREVAAALTMGFGLKDLLDLILERLALVIPNCSSAVVLLENEGPVTFAYRERFGIPQHFPRLMDTRPPTVAAVLELAVPQVINDTHASPLWVHIEGYDTIRAWMGVPLLVKGVCIGLLTVDRDTSNSFMEPDKELAMAFANQVAMGIQNARLFARQKEHAAELERTVREATRDLEVLYGITATAVNNLDLHQLLRRSMALTAEAFGCSAAMIHLLDNWQESLRLESYLENGNQALGQLLTGLDANSPFLRQSLATGEPAYHRGDALPHGWNAHPDLTLITVPLRSRGRNLGILSLLCHEHPHSSDIPSDLLTTIADQIGVAVENIRLYQLTRQSAIIEERERLARDIHDQVTQSIYSAGLFAEAARAAAEIGDLDKVYHHTHSILRMTNQALRELRLLLFEFRTEALARQGLVKALRERLNTVEHRAGVAGEVHATDIDNLSVAIEETFYRIALEALNNALRHAHGDRVDIILMKDEGDLIMTIVDNGIGFDREVAAASGGMGMEGMQKRISNVEGILTFSSSSDGTWVTARAPLTKAI